MGKRNRAFRPNTKLGVLLEGWLRLLRADHDGIALIVAKAVGSLLFEDGAEVWFKLSRISDLIGVSPHIVAGVLYRLRHRGRLHFERRDDCGDGVDPEYRFTLPAEMPEQIERTRVWATKEVKKR